MDTPTKRCTKCGLEFPATHEYFYYHSGTSLRRTCKTCECERHRRYYAANRENIRDKQNQYAEEHRQEAIDRVRRWREANPERERENHRRYREANQTEIAQYMRRYNQAHPGESAKRVRQWTRANPHRRRVHQQRRRARKLNAPGSHTTEDIALQAIAQTDPKGQLRCWWCGGIITERYHVDHRVPLSRGGSDAPENLVISCAPCNMAKHDKYPGEFNGRLL